MLYTQMQIYILFINIKALIQNSLASAQKLFIYLVIYFQLLSVYGQTNNYADHILVRKPSLNIF